MPLINIHAAKTQFSRLVPFAPKSERRRLGILAGQLKVPADSDAPLPDEELDRFEAP